MILSLQSVTFRENDNVQIIHMQNTSQNPLIFKIKITHTNFFSITPPKGIIREREKVPLTIKLIKNCDISAKLQINYAELQQISSQSIDIQLEKVDKQSIKNKIIPITRACKKQKEEKKQQRPLFKTTQSPIYEMEIDLQEKSQSKDNNKKLDSSLKRSKILKSNSNMFKSVEDLDIDKKQSNNVRMEQRKLEKELQYERQLNKRMTERLLQRQKKIMYFNNARQLEINKSFDKEESTIEWSCCNLILIVFICIMIGFFLSKYDLPNTL